MSRTILMAGAVMLLGTAPLAAQQRGTVELSGYVSAGTFDNSLSLTTAYGSGGRAAIFLDPRVALEFEDGEMRASRPNGLRDVNVGILSGRLIFIPVKTGKLSLLVSGGAGAGTETNFMHSYGLNAMVGAKWAIGHGMSVRVDGVQDWLANYDWKLYRRVLMGLSFARNPSHEVRTVTIVAPAPPAPPPPFHEDSVSAAEQARRRAIEADYLRLRDSLFRNPPAPPVYVPIVAPTPPTPVRPTSTEIATMEQRILFAFDKSDLTPVAKATLEDKIPVFQANPTIRITIVGHTDPMGTDDYNLKLGARRAQAAKAYLVSRGIDPSRIEIDTKGESMPVVFPPTPTKAANAPNRRDEFRLIMVGGLRLE